MQPLLVKYDDCAWTFGATSWNAAASATVKNNTIDALLKILISLLLRYEGKFLPCRIFSTCGIHLCLFPIAHLHYFKYYYSTFTESTIAPMPMLMIMFMGMICEVTDKQQPCQRRPADTVGAMA